ncbi:MAG: hypothetical protein K1X75_06220 [Leptospirales bacterium]|nr:hypothetical protein [Leptospirales bacterium]
MHIRSFLQHARWARRLQRSALILSLAIWSAGIVCMAALANWQRPALLAALLLASLATPFVLAAVIEGALLPLVDRRFGLRRSLQGHLSRRSPEAPLQR